MQGTYKLEVWGASGLSNNWGGTGGKGGYCIGLSNQNSNNSIFVCIGNVGGSPSPYNNGNNLPEFLWGTSGGGCTSITTTNRGVLENYESYKSEVLLVGGGGGSVEWGGNGGDGGYPNGGDGIAKANISGTGNAGEGATQTKGGSSDFGVHYQIVTDHTDGGYGKGGYGYWYFQHQTSEGGWFNDYGAQGGGGWYGGGGASYAGAAGGGSSYYKQDTITNFTYKNGVREGNGFAIITWVR